MGNHRFNPDIHHRRSPRLRGYDYARGGAYFVTVCSQNHECLFGSVANGVMELNDAGRMVKRWWVELNSKFPSVNTDAYIIMPNHFHGIAIINDSRSNVGAALRGRPRSTRPSGHPHRGAPTLGNIMDWFKTMTTNNYIRRIEQNHWPPFEKRLWQRNYYERVIRDEAEMDRIREYIQNNPWNWELDEENPDRPLDVM
jgi:putative transposase